MPTTRVKAPASRIWNAIAPVLNGSIIAKRPAEAPPLGGYKSKIFAIRNARP